MSPDIDLFGQPIVDSPSQRRVIHKNGRGWKGGYAAAPGSGPANETCGSCQHYASVSSGSRRYPKCLLMRAHWTHGPGSDIKKRMNACSLWQPRVSKK